MKKKSKKDHYTLVLPNKRISFKGKKLVRGMKSNNIPLINLEKIECYYKNGIKITH